MPSFRYQCLSSAGQNTGGVIAAPDRVSAIRQLQMRGETPTSLALAEDEAPEHGRPGAPRIRADASPRATLMSLSTSRARRPSLPRAETATLIREIATALEAGLPLMQTLRTVRRQVHRRAMATILDFLIERVEAGTPLHQACREYGLPFDDMVVGMIRAADASGRMSEVLHQLADLLDRSVELRREVLGALLYPMIIASLIFVSVILLVTIIVPKLMEPLSANPNMELPWPTQIVLGLAAVLSNWWVTILVVLAVAVVLWRMWIRVPANRLLVDRIKLRTPLVGSLLRDVAVARFTRTLGTLVSAGLPILQALRIVRDTLGNAALMSAIDEVQDRVTTGQSLAEPLERSGYFPPMLVQIVNIGEKSGRLESMLMHAAAAFDRKVNNSIKVFSKALPPVLLVVMASIAGFVLSAILLPLLDLQQAIGG